MRKLLMSTLLIPAAILADVATVGGIEWTYDLKEGQAHITEASLSGVVRIPDKLGECSVTAIGEGAFSLSSGLTEITIPAGINAIAADAFYRCSSLTKVTFEGNEPTSVDEDAFYKVSTNCAVFVNYGTTWSCSVPGTWYEMAISYLPYCDSTLTATSDKKDGDSFRRSTTLTLTVPETCALYYTTDGSEPTTNSAVYASPLTITDTTTIKYLITDSTSGNWSPIYSLTLTRERTNPLYCVIDLSSGPTAKAYQVTYLDEIPAGGWTDEYKTDKLVLRCLDPGSCSVQDSSGKWHGITLTKPFYIGIFEVTQKQYENVMGYNPSGSSNLGDVTRPVDYVSYARFRNFEDCFTSRIGDRTGLNFDLPTEAQWVYACHAGTTTKYSWGDEENSDYMWSDYYLHSVGMKFPNPWGIYDMNGNGTEFCLDLYNQYASNGNFISSEQVWGTDPVNNNSVSYQAVVRRGTSNTDRGGLDKGKEYECYGFRLSLTMTTTVVAPVEITLEANGGNGVVSTQRVASGSELNALPTPTRDGFTFEGWYTAPVGGEKITTTSEDITLYAHWTHNDTYVVANGTATLGDGKVAAVDAQAAGTFTVSSEHNGYPLTKIAGHAFEQCGQLSAVVLPDTITEIGDSAFERCYSLTSITIPASVTNIGYCAFRDCFRLAEVKFLGNRPHLDLGAFMGVPAYAIVSSQQGCFTAVLPTEVNGDVVSIPEGWLDQVATRHRTDTPAGYSSYEEAFAAKYGSDLVKALAKPTGKHDSQGNMMMVWQDFVAGTDPLDEEDVFKATVTLEGGVPVVHWYPVLAESEAARRTYRIFAKTALKNAEWTEVTNLSNEARYEAGYQFFKVTVQMK